MSNAFPHATPHGELLPIFDDAWWLTGTVKFNPVIRLARNMAVLRNGRELTLINAIRLDDAGLKKLEALGDVAHVMRIGIHAMDDAFYLDRYGAKYWSVDRGGLAPSTTELTEDCALPFPDAEVFRFRDTVEAEAAILVRREGGLLITCDSVQHWAPSPLMSLSAKMITRVMGFQKPAQIGPPWKKIMTPKGGTLKPDFERLAGLGFDKLIGAHGGLLERDATDALRATIRREL